MTKKKCVGSETTLVFAGDLIDFKSNTVGSRASGAQTAGQTLGEKRKLGSECAQAPC